MIENCYYKIKDIFILSFVLLLFIGFALPVFAKGSQESMKKKPDLVVINIADTHSAYETYPRIAYKVEELSKKYKGSSLVILFNGDIFESGNIVASKSNGAVDIEFLKHLGQYGKVIINIGNHEFDLMSPADFLSTAEAAGAVVIGTVSAEGMPEVPAYTDILAGEKTVRIIGVGVDQKKVYPKELQETLEIPEPIEWMRENYENLAEGTDYVIIASHAGITPDLAMLNVIGNDTKLLYMAGGHDHITLRRKVNETDYMHNGFKGEQLNVAEIFFDSQAEAEISFTDILTATIKRNNKPLAALIKETEKQTLSPADLEVVGFIKKNMSIADAALWTVETIRKKTGADAVFLNHTSFGSGLKKGALPKYQFDQFMRFNNDIMAAEVDSETLKQIAALCNQQNQTDIYKFSGDFLYTGDIEIESGKQYKIVTSSWAALESNQPKYFGQKLKFEKIPYLTTKGIVTEAIKKK